MNNYMPGDIIPQGPLDQLKESVDKDKMKEWFNQHSGAPVPAFRINIRMDELLRQFIMEGGFEI
jgi:type I restriction enzyme R subunit